MTHRLVCRDCEGSPPDVEDERFHTKRSRLLFQRRMLVRKMGWLENNAYLTRLALEAKAEYVLCLIPQIHANN